MKILSIRLKNLASLSGEHFIDFESDPLASAGLIAIVGKTGAGKSTILDAMCLALFNKIPRLKDSDGKLTDIDGSELLTNSPLTVLRRGTAHGFAELCFVAQDQKHYLVRWEVKRAHEKINGRLKSVQRYLKCLTDGVIIADKTKAVETHIQQITQLSFEQFTRAVLLAQSEVTAFLKARDNERGELLEYLTNSAIFAKIGQLAFEKTKQISIQRKQLENVIGHIELLSEDEITTLTSQFEATQQQCLAKEAEKNRLQQFVQWYVSADKFKQDIAIKEQHYEQQIQAQQALNPDRERLNQLEIFSDIRPHAFQHQQLLKNQQQLEPHIQERSQKFALINTQFEQEKSRYTQAEQDLQRLQQFERQHQQSLSQVRKCVQERDYIAEQYKATKAKIQQLEASQQPAMQQQQQLHQQSLELNQQQQHVKTQLEQSQQYAPLDSDLNTHIQQIKQFIQHSQKIESQIGNLEQAKTDLKQHQKTLADLTETYGDAEKIELDITNHQQQKEQQLQKLHQLNSLEQKFNHYFELKQELTQFKNQTEQLTQTQIALTQGTKTAAKHYEAAKSEREQLQTILQQQRVLHTENIEHLRAELQPNQPCVVCGSLDHPYQNEDTALSKALYQLQQQQEQQALESEKKYFEIWQQTQQQLNQLQAKLSQLQETTSRCDEKLQQQHHVIQQSLESAQLKLDLAQDVTHLKEKLKQEVTQCTEQKLQSEQAVLKLQQQQKHQAQLAQTVQTLVYHVNHIEQLKQSLSDVVKCLTLAEQQHWQHHSLDIAQQVLASLQTRHLQLNQAETAQKQQQQLQQSIHLKEAELSHLNKQLLELQQQLQNIEQNGKKNSETATQLIQHMTGTPEAKAAEWLMQHDQKYQTTQTQCQQLRQHFEQSRQHFEQQKNELDRLNTQHKHNQTAIDQCQHEIEQWLKQHTTFTTQDFPHLLAISHQQEQQIRANLQQAERKLNESHSALNTVQEQFKEHLKQQPEITREELDIQQQQIVEMLALLNEQRDAYKLKLEMHQQNVIKQQQFANQIQSIQEQEHRWSKISSLIGDAKGKDFRDLAQQYHLDILLVYANQQLAMLSQRYTLKRLENSLSLAIVDHDMDGETRSVASLSGGESFLTALALSLAIANMASGSMKIESLFIDEGFGTLDASSLHMVMNALDQLQNQGRKVVLISHIQEMHERIPVQIQVQPLGAGSSKIRVVG